MDKEVRTAHEQIIVDSLLKDQMRHIKMLDAMESNHGLDLDAYTEIYGGSALDGSQKSEVELAVTWKALLEVLEGSENFTAISRINAKLADGCYVFGAPERYDFFEDIVLVDGTAKVESEKLIDGEVVLYLVGQKLFRLEGSEFVSVPKLALAGTDDSALINRLQNGRPIVRLVDQDTQITSRDTLREISNQFGYMREPYVDSVNSHEVNSAFRALEQAHAQ